jgi:hypothetical protein
MNQRFQLGVGEAAASTDGHLLMDNALDLDTNAR